MMLSGKKCPNCNSCLGYIWINNRRLFYCELDKEFYDVKDNIIVKIELGLFGETIRNKVQEIAGGKFS